MSDFYKNTKETSERNYRHFYRKPNFWLKMLLTKDKENMEENVIELSQEEMDAIDAEQAPVIEEAPKDPCEFAFGGYVFKSVSPEDGLHDAVRNDGAHCQVRIESGELKKIVYK